MKEKILAAVKEHKEEILKTFEDLHSIPEWGLEEFKTSAYIKGKLEEAGLAPKKCTETGLIADIEGSNEGPFIGLRGDIDALPYTDEEGKTYYVHACGHDSHATMVLWTTILLKKLGLVEKGKFRAIFQPAEERLVGAKMIIESGVIEDLDELYGAHIRPIQEARMGEATPALWHGASTMMEVTIHGQAAHGARPHLGQNAIDGAAMAILGINTIWANPAQQWSAKVTKIQGGGAVSNIIPDKATFVIDMRAQTNDIMKELIEKVKIACESGANAVGARTEIKILGGVPAAEYDDDAIETLQAAINDILGDEGLLDHIYTPGGEDFHEYVKTYPKLKTAYMGLGSDCTPGLHDPEMTFNKEAILRGIEILTLAMARKLA